MKHSLLILATAALAVLSSCGNRPKIENWEPLLFESVGAPFLKQPAHFIEFHGPYADGENDEGISFSFETKNHAQSRKYVEQCIKAIEKYADKIYDVSEYTRSTSKLTLEKLQEYAVRKGDIKLKGSQWGGGYSCDVIYSKDGRYFKFTGGYGVYNNHERATCMVGFFPLPHLSAL